MTGIFAASPLSSRKLQGDLSQSPSSSQALQSPQSSASAVACSDRAWSLSLQPGANQFLLLVTAPGAAVSPAQLNASADIILVTPGLCSRVSRHQPAPACCPNAACC